MVCSRDGDDNGLASIVGHQERTGWFKPFLSLLLKAYRGPRWNQKLDEEIA
jgi:hypothetical protein